MNNPLGMCSSLIPHTFSPGPCSLRFPRPNTTFFPIRSLALEFKSQMHLFCAVFPESPPHHNPALPPLHVHNTWHFPLFKHYSCYLQVHLPHQAVSSTRAGTVAYGSQTPHRTLHDA